MAYLLDLQTIRIVDLRTQIAEAVVAHDAKIDWLEVATGCSFVARLIFARLWLDVVIFPRSRLSSSVAEPFVT